MNADKQLDILNSHSSEAMVLACSRAALRLLPILSISDEPLFFVDPEYRSEALSSLLKSGLNIYSGYSDDYDAAKSTHNDVMVTKKVMRDNSFHRSTGNPFKSKSFDTSLFGNLVLNNHFADALAIVNAAERSAKILQSSIYNTGCYLFDSDYKLLFGDSDKPSSLLMMKELREAIRLDIEFINNRTHLTTVPLWGQDSPSPSGWADSFDSLRWLGIGIDKSLIGLFNTYSKVIEGQE